MSKLDRITTFVRVIDKSSFAAAARSLQLSTAAVSKQISTLEDELGVQLLHRTTRRVSASEIGQIYYAHCKDILSRVSEADAIVAQTHEEPFGLLRVVSGRHFAERYIVPHVAEFAKQYPQIVFDLELAERIPDLDKENIDVLIGMSISATSDCIQRTIAKTRYVLCASPNYLRRYGTPRKPDELKGHHYITHTMRRPNDIVGFARGKEVQVKPVLRVNDANAMLQFALDGIGIVKLHEYVVAEAIRAKKLKEILTDFAEETELPIYVSYQANRYLQPKIRHFIDFVLAKMQSSSH